jgi:hypothetical protein
MGEEYSTQGRNVEFIKNWLEILKEGNYLEDLTGDGL